MVMWFRGWSLAAYANKALLTMTFVKRGGAGVKGSRVYLGTTIFLVFFLDKFSNCFLRCDLGLKKK